MKVWKKIGLVVLAAVVLGGGYLTVSKVMGSGDSSVGARERVEVVRDSMDVTVSASGPVVATRQASLSFDSAGTVVELSVELADRVKEGQVLARLQTSSLERLVSQAEAGVKTAQLNLEKAQDPFDENDLAQAEAAVAQAEAGVKTAQLNLEKAQDPFDENDLAQAEAGVKTAQLSLDKLLDLYDEGDIARAEAAVSSAQAALKTVEDALKDTRELYDDNDLANAQASVRNATVALENARLSLESTLVAQASAVTVAESAVSDGEKAYSQEINNYYIQGCSPQACSQTAPEKLVGSGVVDEVVTAWRNLEKARSDLEVARIAQTTAIAVAENVVDRAEVTLVNAEESLADVIEGADAIDIEIRGLQVSSAEAALSQAQSALADIKGGADALDIEQSKVQVESAQAALADMRAAPKAVDLKLSQRQVESAQAALLQAQSQLAHMKAGTRSVDLQLLDVQARNADIALAEARERLDKATMRAPFDGLVAGVNNKVWDKVAAGAVVIRLVDPQGFKVEATVDELDVYQVEPGQAVHISLDAIPGDILSGTVVSLSPVARRETGVISYKVTISLQPIENITLKDGLTASTEIVVESRQNILLVPSRAVTVSGGKSVVYLIVDDKARERVISTGLRYDGHMEVLSGLNEGDTVLMRESND
ncbi:MAG: efflux RND transporter periplasmic adaptor subunit [Dehalococcoidia bacterium]|nr:efflux RND transporter periplasmic adaptor subunit [Dehalococcoidia bacterium]